MKNKRSLLLNLGLLAYLLIMMIFILPMPVTDAFMFLTEDSREYLSAGSEFFDFHATGASYTRPFLFPVFVKTFYTIGGPVAIWIAQLALWLLSANLLFSAIFRWTKSWFLAILSLLVFITNFSLLALTFHALTEVPATFLLCLLVYLLSKREKINEAGWFLKILAVLIALTLIKPLFLYPLFAAMLTGILRYFRQFTASPKLLLAAALILCPLLLQYSVMKVKYDKWQLSAISGLTLRRYFIAQGYQKIELLPRDSAVAIAENLTSTELSARLKEHAGDYRYYFFQNVESNISTEPAYLKMTKEAAHQGLFDYQMNTNVRYLKWFFTLLVISLLVAIHQFMKRRIRAFIPVWLAFALAGYIVYSSGISFYQADRLTIFALPLVLFVLTAMIHYSFTWRKVKLPSL